MIQPGTQGTITAGGSRGKHGVVIDPLGYWVRTDAGVVVGPFYSDKSFRPDTVGSQPVTDWRAALGPLTDTDAAARVTRAAEVRPENREANAYRPSDAQLAAFHAFDAGQQNSWRRFVTGRPGIANPSTDDLIQWTAHKWGIPEDVIRAQLVQESRWRQSQEGDLKDGVYESQGICQVKYRPDPAAQLCAGGETLRDASTAFNLDYYAASIRFYYDDPGGKRTAWGDSSYHPGDGWGSVGAWFAPYPFNNPQAQTYITQVKAHMAARTWAQPGF